MSAVGIILEDGVMIGPHVTLLTVNHALKDLQIIKCKPVTIKKEAWIGANVTILPGVTVGEGCCCWKCQCSNKRCGGSYCRCRKSGKSN